MKCHSHTKHLFALESKLHTIFPSSEVTRKLANGNYEGLLTEKECLEDVESMELGKSPGTDGLPTEFYKVFWKDISPFLISSLNRSYQQGKLAITQRRGIISLIPKKDKALNKLKS